MSWRRPTVQQASPTSGSDSSSSEPDLGNSSKSVDRLRLSVYQKDCFVPGIVLRAVHHEQDRDSKKPDAADQYRTDTYHGSVYSKVRHTIVVACYKNHYQALMVYSHNGKGLDGKKNPDEYVSITNRRSTLFQRLSSHDTLYTEYMDESVYPLHPTSTVCITYPVSRAYEHPVIMEGKLTNKSIKDLQKLYLKAQASAMKLSLPDVLSEESLENDSLSFSPLSPRRLPARDPPHHTATLPSPSRPLLFRGFVDPLSPLFHWCFLTDRPT